MAATTATVAAAANNGETNTFSDIIKNSITNNFVNDVDLSKIIITMAISFLIGFFIFLLYKRVFSGVLYSRSFNVSLIGMTLVTSMVIIAINSNLVLSLGMVGALSIVRFRTPIKDPTDLIFLFWAAAAGIVTGAGFFSLAIAGSVIIGIIMFIFIKKSSFETPYLLVVNCDGDDSEKTLLEQVHGKVKRYNVKQKTVTPGNIELTLEVRVKEKESGFVNAIAGLRGVKNAVLISYSGDYIS
jgi:uncharacterized membrane protein YhiD involved in acid resistance